MIDKSLIWLILSVQTYRKLMIVVIWGVIFSLIELQRHCMVRTPTVANKGEASDFCVSEQKATTLAKNLMRPLRSQ